MIQLTEEQLKNLIFEITHNVMGIDAECLENKATPTELADKLYQYRQDKLNELITRFKTNKANLNISVVRSFSSKINRYDIYSNISYGDHPCSTLEIDGNKDGEWVKYSDVIDLFANGL